MLICTKLIHSENAELLKLITLLGIVIDVKPKQFENADSPMEVTLLGIVIDVKFTQFENTDSLMELTLSLMLT